MTAVSLADELRAGLGGRNVCGEAEAERCRIEHGDWLEWACQACSKLRLDDLSERAKRALFLRSLALAGYPFRANDLDLETWIDLGLAARIDDELRLETELAPYIKT